MRHKKVRTYDDQVDGERDDGAEVEVQAVGAPTEEVACATGEKVDELGEQISRVSAA